MNIFKLLKPKSTVTFLYKTDTLGQGLEKLRAEGYTAVPVIDETGEYIGTVSEGDFLWHFLQYGTCVMEEHRLVNIVNEERNKAVRIDVTMDELLARVMDQNFVPVIDDRSTFIGIVTRKDIIGYFSENCFKTKAAAE